MTAVIRAVLMVTSAPVELVKKDGTPVITVAAREADDQGKRQLFQLFGPSEKSRRTIAGLGPGDAVSVVGPIAVRIEAGGAAIIQVNAVDCSMQLPIKPKPKPKPKKPKPLRPKSPGQSGHRGTRMASHEGVAKAQAEWTARNGGHSI
jgi:hypothetical protein